MVQASASALPQTFDEFLNWEPTDGYKCEWNDGELIQSSGKKKKQYFIYGILNKLFFKTGYIVKGMLMAEPDVMLTSIQMRRPDIAYFTYEQTERGRQGEDVIPAFVIEILSETDQAYRIEEKIAEYFKAGVQVVWNINPEHEVVYVYTSRKNVMICLENDVCSAAPVLPDFSLTVNELFAPSVS
ncbi:Uma2 family endonuclease [Spirosoma sp. BT702]|uniref:Uma2 family endonuclease n=1 Tax=Spirosoma profusum TaxID=2771354 RepID=A0A926XV58_9BACT|nr:Uma2 family endonuclease [Spirosoma profusum]MBD2701164.1 Uma2 family endonuclease [Spirosoma profusum]